MYIDILNVYNDCMKFKRLYESFTHIRYSCIGPGALFNREDVKLCRNCIEFT